MQTKWPLVLTLLLIAAPVARADSLQLILNTSALVNVSSPNDNFYGTYVNVPSEPIQFGLPQARGLVFLPVPDLSLSLPAGSIITSALEIFIVPTEAVFGTGYITVPGERFGGSDPSLPSVAPTFSTNGTSNILVDGFVLTKPADVSGDEVSFSVQSLPVDYVGQISSALEDP